MDSPLFSAWQYHQKITDWREAIYISCQPLYQQHIITENYSSAIIHSTTQTGCWYILSPGFALPHARPQQGVVSDSSHLSLLRISENCLFPGNEPIGLVIVLAAVNNHQHINMIQRLLNWLDRNNRLQHLLTCQNQHELQWILQET